jgi:hypothetical protein
MFATTPKASMSLIILKETFLTLKEVGITQCGAGKNENLQCPIASRTVLYSQQNLLEVWLVVQMQHNKSLKQQAASTYRDLWQVG